MSQPRRVDSARSAYANQDVAASAAAHTPEKIAEAAQEQHGGAASQYIGDLVYGGLDGIVTTFAVVSGVAGADLGTSVILILGLANLFADGFSMATGAYLSSKSEQEYYEREWERESWEAEHFPDGERLELIEVYRHQGYSDEEARTLVEIQSRHPQQWVEAMMVHELSLLPDDRKPLRSGLATFLAFVVAGSLPLLVYLVGLATPIASGTAFATSIALSALALYGLGAAKVVITRMNAVRSGIEMLVVGGLAASVAYIVGALLKGIG